MTTSTAPGPPRPVTPMSILAGKLEVLVRRLDAVDKVDDAFRSELREACALAGGLDPYLSAWTTPQSPELLALDRRTGAHNWDRRAQTAIHLEQEMLSGHVEGQTLKMLVHATRAQRVLEIGMFTGYSALAMAEALPANGIVVACEIDAEVADFARQSFETSPAGHKIDIRVGPAQASLDELAGTAEPFDLVFIDADKAGYLDYFRTVLDAGLLAPHGLICADNTLLQGQPWCSGTATPNGMAIAEFNRAVAADPRVEQVIIPLRDGLTLIRQVLRN
jgi:caffeoyl-CoA O-methyltransferase